jgi:glutathione S-transferase
MSQITLFTHPHSRGRTALWLLEELKIPYTVKLVDFPEDGSKDPALLAVNPMGQVPTITHGDLVLTEQAAICVYLSDAFPQTGLSPAINDPLRAPYLRYMFFAANSLEAAITDKIFPRATKPREGAIGYGKFEDVITTLEKLLAKGPYALGEKFSSLDVFLGSQLQAGVSMAKVIEAKPAFTDYLQRLSDRPAFQSTQAKTAQQFEQMKEKK